jgi:hypothetical protein
LIKVAYFKLQFTSLRLLSEFYQKRNFRTQRRNASSKSG